MTRSLYAEALKYKEKEDAKLFSGKFSLEDLKRRFPDGIPGYSILGKVLQLHNEKCQYPGWPITHLESDIKVGFIEDTYALNVYHDEKVCRVEYDRSILL